MFHSSSLLLLLSLALVSPEVTKNNVLYDVVTAPEVVMVFPCFTLPSRVTLGYISRSDRWMTDVRYEVLYKIN